MWIITKIGFFSIVQKPWSNPNDTLTVKARARTDLENLRAYLPEMSEIIASEDSDYRYRATADREAVMAMASRIVANPARSLRMAKRLLLSAQEASLDITLEMSSAMQSIAHETVDHLEAVDAFLEKRVPNFTGA
jgi:enoyl-CoA hydratase/carnithine racemase